MKHISKHFTGDNYDQVVLEKKDWDESVWKTILAIFDLQDAEKIVVSEYKLEAWSKKEE